MYLFISIILSTVLGAVLLLTHPLIGGIIAFGIIGGCLFRGLYLISDIHKQILSHSPKVDRVQKAFNEYIDRKKIEY